MAKKININRAKELWERGLSRETIAKELGVNVEEFDSLARKTKALAEALAIEKSPLFQLLETGVKAVTSPRTQVTRYFDAEGNVTKTVEQVTSVSANEIKQFLQLYLNLDLMYFQKLQYSAIAKVTNIRAEKEAYTFAEEQKGEAQPETFETFDGDGEAFAANYAAEIIRQHKEEGKNG